MRAALWGHPVEFDGNPDWEGIMRIARHHATAVLVADVASRLDMGLLPPASMLQEMKSAMRFNFINQLELKRILVAAVTALRSKGIEPVLLKGFSLSRLYPNPNLRQFGDIDLYVGIDRFHEACTVLRSLPGGYNWGEEVDVGRHYNIEFGRFPLEVHRESADVTDSEEQAVYTEIERDGLIKYPQHVDFEGFDLVVPSKELSVFFTFFHAWHHFTTSGVGWRQISDVAMTLHAYLDSQRSPTASTFDVAKLHKWITEMHLMEPWQVFGWLMVNCLGLPKEELPFYDDSCRRKAERLYTRVMAEGNFRRHSHFKLRKPTGRVQKKTHSFVGIFVDFFHLAHIFPKSAFRGLKTALKSGFSKNFQKKMNFFVAV